MKLFFGVFLIASLVMLSSSVYKAKRAVGYLSGESAYARIVDVKTSRRSGSEMYRPILKYAYEGREQVIVDATWSFSRYPSSNYQEGRTIKILYIKGNKNDIVRNSFWGVWGSVIISFILFVPFFLVGILPFIVEYKNYKSGKMA